MSKKVVCHNIKGEEKEVEVEKLEYRPSVYGILIEDGKVLLSKQWDGYDLPGGGMNMHETIQECLVREFFEETGLNVKVGDVVYCGTDFFDPSHSEKYKNQYWNCQLIYYIVEKVGGELSIKNFDEDEKNYADMPEWISLDKLNGLKFYNGVDTEAIIKKANNILNNE